MLWPSVAQPDFAPNPGVFPSGNVFQVRKLPVRCSQIADTTGHGPFYQTGEKRVECERSVASTLRACAAKLRTWNAEGCIYAMIKPQERLCHLHVNNKRDLDACLG